VAGLTSSNIAYSQESGHDGPKKVSYFERVSVEGFLVVDDPIQIFRRMRICTNVVLRI